MEAYPESTVLVPQQTLRCGLQRKMEISHYLSSQQHTALRPVVQSELAYAHYGLQQIVLKSPEHHKIQLQRPSQPLLLHELHCTRRRLRVLHHKCWRTVGSRIRINGRTRGMQQSLSFPEAIAGKTNSRERSSERRMAVLGPLTAQAQWQEAPVSSLTLTTFAE